MAELREYVEDRLRQGYPPNVVRTQMIAYGYSSSEIDAVLSRTDSHHIIDFSPKLVIILIAAAIAFVAALFAAFSFFVPAEALLDISSHPVQSEVHPGGTILWVNELVNLGGRQKINVEVLHELKQKKTGRTLDSKKETIAIEAHTSSTAQFIVPKGAAFGEYVVSTTAAYSGKRASSSFRFNVVPVQASFASCSDGMQNQGENGVDCGGPCTQCPEDTGLQDCPGGCDDFDSCTVDSCVTGRCVHRTKVPCCGNYACEQGETPLSCAEDCALKVVTKTPDQLIADAEKTAAKAPSRAAGICAGILQSAYSDRCYGMVASAAKQASYCANIQNQDTKDGCYLNYAQATNDYSICKKLQNRLYRSSCESFKMLAK